MAIKSPLDSVQMRELFAKEPRTWTEEDQAKFSSLIDYLRGRREALAGAEVPKAVKQRTKEEDLSGGF